MLRATIEAGVSPDIERRLNDAKHLVTSRLSPVESARVFLRLRKLGEFPETALADAEKAARSVWMRCEIVELSETVCDLAARVAPGSLLRALDTLHLASFLMVRHHIEDLELLTVDERLLASAEGL